VAVLPTIVVVGTTVVSVDLVTVTVLSVCAKAKASRPRNIRAMHCFFILGGVGVVVVLILATAV
jgi:hypothetical protein